MSDRLPTKQIGGRVFTFEKIPATQAMRIVVPLSKFLAAPLFEAAKVMQTANGKVAEAVQAALAGGKDLKDVKPSDVMTPEQTEKQIEALGGAVEKLVASLDAEELIKIQVVVFASVRCMGHYIKGEDGINATFEGDLGSFMAVFVEALKVNFAGFFPASLSGLIDGLASKLSPSSQPTSTGTSGPP